MKVKDSIIAYKPSDGREEADKRAFLEFIERNPDHLLRSNETGHITVSAWIVNKQRTKVLFCYHNIYNSWSWVGGHADGEEQLIRVALKEAEEETGIRPKCLSEEIFSLEILPVLGHIKKGKYVPSHLHYNITYLFEADENAPVRINGDENSAVGWIKTEDIEIRSTEKWMIENIYKKLIKKTKLLCSP